MYFGSVRFFKHLILGTIALLIIVPIVISIVLGVQGASKDSEIERLKQQNSLLTKFSETGSIDADSLANLAKTSEVDMNILVERLYGIDKEAFKSIEEKSAQTSNATESSESTAALTEKAPPSTEALAASSSGETSEYSALYPEMYADDGEDPAAYIDDTNTVYFTFDDGPSKYTADILEYLSKYDIKATFFVIPDDNADSAHYLEQMIAAGHTIGIHTTSHDFETIYTSVESYLDDFYKAFSLVYKQTGLKAKFFRFPGGSVNEYNASTRDAIIAEMTRRGFVYFDWNVDSLDAQNATWTEMYNKVPADVAQKSESDGRAVILMHDRPGGVNTVLVLEDIIKALVNDPKGYKFSAITNDVRPLQF